MQLVTDTSALAALCARLSQNDYITIDTEFMRETTYWSRLCLVQLAAPDGEAAIVDPMSDSLSLEPLDNLLADTGTLKVFHAARQDIEIFYHRAGSVPAPIFDTQIAGMVCGFGESAGYETLVRKIAKQTIDSSTECACGGNRARASPPCQVPHDRRGRSHRRPRPTPRG